MAGKGSFLGGLKYNTALHCTEINAIVEIDILAVPNLIEADKAAALSIRLQIVYFQTRIFILDFL